MKKIKFLFSAILFLNIILINHTKSMETPQEKEKDRKAKYLLSATQSLKTRKKLTHQRCKKFIASLNSKVGKRALEILSIKENREELIFNHLSVEELIKIDQQNKKYNPQTYLLLVEHLNQNKFVELVKCKKVKEKLIENLIDLLLIRNPIGSIDLLSRWESFIKIIPKKSRETYAVDQSYEYGEGLGALFYLLSSDLIDYEIISQYDIYKLNQEKHKK